mmetsp:Transcript_121842/g.272271  ORF Transcript_121842/g.272271 Transcript_121842/m.272271 type:complete len:436 (+) Transcript_121842:1463-2770(+)
MQGSPLDMTTVPGAKKTMSTHLTRVLATAAPNFLNWLLCCNLLRRPCVTMCCACSRRPSQRLFEAGNSRSASSQQRLRNTCTTQRLSVRSAPQGSPAMSIITASPKTSPGRTALFQLGASSLLSPSRTAVPSNNTYIAGPCGWLEDKSAPSPKTVLPGPKRCVSMPSRSFFRSPISNVARADEARRAEMPPGSWPNLCSARSVTKRSTVSCAASDSASGSSAKARSHVSDDRTRTSQSQSGTRRTPLCALAPNKICSLKQAPAVRRSRRFPSEFFNTSSPLVSRMADWLAGSTLRARFPVARLRRSASISRKRRRGSGASRRQGQTSQIVISWGASSSSSCSSSTNGKSYSSSTSPGNSLGRRIISASSCAGVGGFSSFFSCFPTSSIFSSEFSRSKVRPAMAASSPLARRRPAMRVWARRQRRRPWTTLGHEPA